MKRHFFYSKLLYKDDGSAIIEFAIVAPVFFLLFFAVTEFGLYSYSQMATERIATEVARLAAIGRVSDTGCPATTNQIDYIKCFVKGRTAGLINRDRIEVQVNTVAAGGVVVPDICLDNPDSPSSAPATCTTYEDVNNNGKYDGTNTLDADGKLVAISNAGVRGQIIEVRISYPWSVQFPIMSKYFGSDAHKGISMITASTIIKNEPY